MNFWVHIGVRAEKSLKTFPAADVRRILAAMEAMRLDPLSGDVVKLKGQGKRGFRRRVGDYRILFQIDFVRRWVIVSDVLRRTTTTY
ncbi:MAG TPA: hypothetical protein VK433_08700 [Stellaceae bacterium]|nr:hypothetical protein [Stellaceae bacterium]